VVHQKPPVASPLVDVRRQRQKLDLSAIGPPSANRLHSDDERDPRLGERNCLCIVPKPGSAPTLEEIVEFLRGRVADYKLPEELFLMSEFPMTPTGKVKRPELVNRVRASAH
jgi:acyl-CoA synthetase (AMP-forming)/AMP-acid ligase II